MKICGNTKCCLSTEKVKCHSANWQSADWLGANLLLPPSEGTLSDLLQMWLRFFFIAFDALWQVTNTDGWKRMKRDALHFYSTRKMWRPSAAVGDPRNVRASDSKWNNWSYTTWRKYCDGKPVLAPTLKLSSSLSWWHLNSRLFGDSGFYRLDLKCYQEIGQLWQHSGATHASRWFKWGNWFKFHHVWAFCCSSFFISYFPPSVE